jgi:hypothetical protein
MTEAAATQNTTAPAVPPHQIEPLKGTIKARVHAMQDFSVVVPMGTPKDDILRGEFWVHHLGRMQPGDEIRCLWEDSTAYARIIMLHNQGRLSVFKCLEWHQFETLIDQPLGAAYNLEVKNRGIMKWCIIDTMNGEILEKMIPDQKEALSRMEALIRRKTG